ncbi:MAG: hypothetical protein VX840_08035, partial [Pseudomonadota bacterium]|nr:hypothetical protein [Pseudomonadota bacterium]
GDGTSGTGDTSGNGTGKGEEGTGEEGTGDDGVGDNGSGSGAGGFGLGLGIGMFGGGGVQQPQRGTPVKVPNIYDPMQLPGLLAIPQSLARVELEKVIAELTRDVA